MNFTAQGNTKEVNVGLDEEARDTFVLQEAAAEVAWQGAGFSHAEDLLELFRNSEGEAEPAMETQATQWKRASVMESSKFEPEEQPRAQLSIPGPQATSTKKITKAQSSKSSKSSASVAEVGMKK